MFGMTLPDQLPSGIFWSEEIPQGSVQSSSMNFASDSGKVVLNIRIAGGVDNLRQAIAYILGYSEVQGDTDHGPYVLFRKTPARHPAFPALRATQILSAQGRGLKDYGGVDVLSGVYGEWALTYLSIMFEIPRYPILEDSENTIAGVRQPEYRRYCEWDFDINLETLARKGITWYFLDSNAKAVTRTFPGDRMLRQPKGVLKITWYDVHWDWVYLGRIIPSNYFKRVGTVNALAFPQFPYRDQNVAGFFGVQFQPGTCLLMPPKIKSRTQNHPAVMKDEINPDYFPRTVDVETSMLIFDPDTDDRGTVDLSAILGGNRATPIRGHNLCPLPRPSATGYSWYASYGDLTPPLTGGPPSRITSASNLARLTDEQTAYLVANPVFFAELGALSQAHLQNQINVFNAQPPDRLAVALQNVQTNILYTLLMPSQFASQNQLLYQYSDFEQLWASPESLF